MLLYYRFKMHAWPYESVQYEMEEKLFGRKKYVTVRGIGQATVFSERELTFTFAICYRPSVCRLSVVCNVRAPYSGGSNFRQYFYGIRYLGHP